MDIAEIRHLIKKTDSSKGWVDPWLITGINIQKSRDWNYRVYWCDEEMEEIEIDDTDIVEYLTMFTWLFDSNREGIFGTRIVEALVYLIKTMWSVDAVIRIPIYWNKYFQRKEMNECLDILKEAYKEACYQNNICQWHLWYFTINLCGYDDGLNLTDWQGILSSANFQFLSNLWTTTISKIKFNIPKELYSQAANVTTSSQILSELAFHEDNVIRRLVATNSKTPCEVLTKLANGDNDIWVKLALLNNPNTPQNLIPPLKFLKKEFFNTYAPKIIPLTRKML
jgi:hypothetical protein